MKKTSKFLIILFILFLLFSSTCLATNNTNTDTSPITSSNNATQNTTNEGDSASIHVINSDVYLGKKEVVIEDAINGNAFVTGTSVTIKGQIIGDLFVVANTLVIEEDALVSGNIIALAPSFTLKGEAYDVYALSNNFELSSTATIYRDLKAYAGTVILNGVVQKDAYLLTNSITMPEDAKNLIGGNLHYTSPRESTIPEGAVMGGLKYTQFKQATPTTEQIITSYLTKFISTLLYAVVIILLATFFAPKFIAKANYSLMQRPFISAGIGILSIVLIPVIAIFFMISGVLAYIGIAMAAVYGLILSITLALFGMAIAKSIEKKLKNPSKLKFILFSVLAAIVLWLLQIIPYIGTYASLFIYVMGLGVFLLSFFSKKDGNNERKSDKK